MALPPDLRKLESIERHYAATPFVRDICLTTAEPSPGPSTASLANGADGRFHALVVAHDRYLRERRIVGVSEWIRFELETLSAGLTPADRIRTCRITLEPLPRTSAGDVDREEVARRMARPAQVATVQVDSPDSLARHALEIASRFSGRVASPEAHLDLDLGIDSIARVELGLALQREIGIEADETQMAAASTVRDLTEVLRAGSPAAITPPADPWEAVLLHGEHPPSAATRLRRPRLTRAAGFALLRALRPLARATLGLRLEGIEHLPKRGPYLLCPNHQTLADGFLLAALLPYRTWRDLFFVGASEYYATRASAAFARTIGIVPIDADGNLAAALRTAADLLRAGRVLMLFPEGERSIDGGLKGFRRGGPILATRLRVPIVPVGVSGAFARWPRGCAFEWGRFAGRGQLPVRVRLGRPMVPGVSGVPLDDRALAEALRERVAALLP